MSKADLRVDWATHEAAKYACEHWHYSRCAPAGKLVKIGAWESNKFIGVVLFSRGANKNMARSFGLDQTECCELTRIALTDHIAPVSRIVALALRLLSRQSGGIRLVISYADQNQGHHGGIYQAGNWLYSGVTTGTHQLRMPDGSLVHKRTAVARWGTCDSKRLNARYEYPKEKHRYLMSLDAEMRAKIAPLAKPYPKRDKQAMADDQSAQRRGSADRHAPSSDPT